jgi:hypothetical protein
LRRIEQRAIDAGQAARGARSHAAHRVAQQRRKRLYAQRWIGGLQAVGGGGANLGVDVARRLQAQCVVSLRIGAQRGKRGGANDRRLGRVAGQCGERCIGAELPGTCRGERRAVVRAALSAEPAGDCLRGPRRRLARGTWCRRRGAGRGIRSGRGMRRL